MSNKGRGILSLRLKTESGRILGASGSGWCRCSYTAAFFGQGRRCFRFPATATGAAASILLTLCRSLSGATVKAQTDNACLFYEVVWIIYFVFKGVFVVRVTLISPTEFRFVSTEFAVKSDQHGGCFPRGAPRRFFEVLFLGHTFIVSGQFSEVPVFRGFRSAC